MRYPNGLKDHGRIGFIAPSFGAGEAGYYRERFDAAIEKFKKLGYQCIIGPNCYEEKGVGKSNTPEKCAAEINDFFTNDRSDVIISCGGGETMCEDLPFTAFDRIKESDPKWFCGYSDNTNLTFLLPLLCDTAAIYGPNAPSFGMRPWHQALKDCMRILTGAFDNKKPEPDSPMFTFQNYDGWEKKDTPQPLGKNGQPDHLAPFIITEPYELSVYAPGHIRRTKKKVEMEGRLMGGCLEALCNLCGTRFDRVKEFNEKYRNDGTLWFLESCYYMPMELRRGLWQLRQAGWFDTAKGFLIGRDYLFDAEECGQNRISAVTGALADLNVPIMIDADLGHLPPAMPIITGAYGKVTAENNRLVMTQTLR